MEISIVTTLYNSSKFVEEFISRTERIISKINCSHEIILVDDGSSDNSVETVLNRIKFNKNIKLIKLSKNFGHHKAILCGLSHSKANYTFLIDVDLEEEPELLEVFYKTINKEKVDLVYGVQERRNKDKFSGKMYWKLISILTDVNVNSNACTVRIMNRDFINKLINFPQKDFFLGELSSYIGMKQSVLKVEKNYKGNSSYNFFMKFNMFFNMIFNNSEKIWVKLSLICILLSTTSLLIGFFFICSHLLGSSYLNGWLSIIISISLSSSVTLFFCAIILHLQAKILIETRAKPKYIIDQIYSFEK